MANKNLTAAKAAKNDEFYTQLTDIERELQHYWQHFRGKVVLCNCDDPYESNFFKYFALRFNQLGLKKLICTCYDGSPVMGSELSLFALDAEGEEKKVAYKVEITEVSDVNGDGAVDLADVEYLIKNDKNVLSVLRGNGDFRSQECIELLKEADIVVTNPPFSLFREYVAQLVQYEKKFLIIGNKNSITYKEVFPLIKENKLWVGVTPMSKDLLFYIPEKDQERLLNEKKAGSAYRIVEGKIMGRSQSIWLTNLDHNKRHEMLDLVCRYSPEEYPTYDNYNAIEVGKTADIPCDYDGAMGVPITFLDKYNPEQFEILNANHYRKSDYVKIKSHGLIKDKEGAIDGKPTYVRILIRNKHPQKI